MLGRNRAMTIIFFGLILSTIGIWIVKIVNDELPYVDQWTRTLVDRYADTNVYTFFRGITELGSQSFLIPFVVVMAFVVWWMLQDYLPALIFAGGTLASHLINTLIKNLVARERPSISVAANAQGHSFPSGHAMISMVCYGMLAYFIIKKLHTTKAIFFVQLFFALLVFLIGLSRFFINVHYLTDILTGFFLGYICLIALIKLYERMKWQENQS